MEETLAPTTVPATEKPAAQPKPEKLLSPQELKASLDAEAAARVKKAVGKSPSALR